MENLTNQVLDLENGKKYFILRQAVFMGKTFFFAAEMTEDEEDFTNEFVFLEAIEDNGLTVKRVTDKNTLEVLAKNVKLD